MHRHRAEPNLEEALSDDLVQAMMKADRVDPTWLRALLGNVARQRRLDRPAITVKSRCRLQDGSSGARLP